MERFFRCSLTFLLILATVMECIQVCLRYIFELPLMWLDETIIFPAIWMYMLGCANASREKTQIVAKILPVFFPGPKPVAFFDFCAELFSAIISSWLCWYAVEYFFYCIHVNRKTSYLFLPLYIGEIAVCVGLVFMTVYCFIHLVQSTRAMCQTFNKGDAR